MSDDSQADDSSPPQDPKNTEVSAGLKNNGSLDGEPELQLTGDRPGAAELANLPHRKAERKSEDDEQPVSDATEQKSTSDDESPKDTDLPNDHSEHNEDHDPYHHDHDDYHDPAHYEDDYHHDHHVEEHNPEDDWWEEDEEDEDDQLAPEGEMSFLDHLEELRWTIFKSLAALILGCVLVGINLKLFADWLQAPIEYVAKGSGGLVYAVTDENKLQALERNSGKFVWEADCLYKPLADDEGSLYVVASETKLIALDGRSGKSQWELDTSGPVRAPPVMDGKGFLYLPVGDEKVLAVNSANGKVTWEREIAEGIDNSLLLPPSDDDIELRTRQPLGVLMVLMQVVFFGGLAISMPFILLFASGFIAPGLTPREKRMLLPGSLAGVGLFLAGAALAFFFIIPVSLRFSAVLNDWMGIELLWDVNDYYSLVVMVTLAVGALFQFPLLLVIMGYLGILPSDKLKKGRKVVFVIIMIVAALLTPGDVIVALVLLTVPLYMLFEGSILMVAYVERSKARREARIEEKRKQRMAARRAAKQTAAKAVDGSREKGKESQSEGD